MIAFSQVAIIRSNGAEVCDPDHVIIVATFSVVPPRLPDLIRKMPAPVGVSS